MKRLTEPYYRKYINGELKRFDERNTGFSRGASEGDKYAQIYRNGVRNIVKKTPGKTIFDHSMGVAAKSVDQILRKTAYAREGSPTQNKTYRLKHPDPGAMTRIVKNAARWFGADLVGVAWLNPLWIYSYWGLHNVQYTDAAKEGDPIDIPSRYENAVIMVHEMDYNVLTRNPYREPSTPMGYSRMAWTATMLATFIRELGYSAIPSGNELGINIPLAVDAGLGELGRNGLLITPEFGPRVRISKVFTDLPLMPDSPIDIGIQGFCEKCGRCAESCPSQAIMSGEKTEKAWDQSNSEGLMKWPVRAMRCFEWWVKNGTGCSVCIRVCPWNKPNNNLLHKFVRLFAERGLFTRAIVRIDKWFGYGRQRKDLGYAAWQDPSVTEIRSSRENASVPDQ